MHPMLFPVRRGQHKLAPVLKYISDNISGQLSVENVASAAGMSTYTLYDKFNEIFQCTPWKYITKQRLEQARMLLISQPELSIKEIGIMCGMGVRSYFSKHFSELYGITPSEYRKSNTSVRQDAEQEKILPVYLIKADEKEYDINCEIEINNLGCYQIVICHSGSGIITDENGEESFLRPGYMCLFTPETQCVLHAVDTGLSISSISFNGRYLKKCSVLSEYPAQP